MNKNKYILKSILKSIFICFLVFSFSGCLKEKETINYEMNLEVWGVFDDSDAFEELNQRYVRNSNTIKDIKYKKISANSADFEKELIDTLSSGKGPDVIFFHNTWLTKHGNKLAPLPDSESQLANYQKTFVDVAKDDFVKENKIYAMPLYCDTLALYYNKNLFNQAGIASPPETWSEILSIVPTLTDIDSYGNINQSAIALGRSTDPGGVNRSSDIFSLIMMQNGGNFLDSYGTSTAFGNQSASKSALEFYTSFALGGNENYTWNSNMDYSVDSFRYGKTAMMINYSYWMENLRAKDPKFNFGISMVPQNDLNNKTSFANYWGLGVVNVKDLSLNVVSRSKKSNFTNEDRINEAWKYIMYVTAGAGKTSTTESQKSTGVGWGDLNSDFDPTEKYLTVTKKPAARRDLIEKQMENVDFEVFAEQALIAKSWPQPDEQEIDSIFSEMINDVINGRATVSQALKTAASRVDNLLRN